MELTSVAGWFSRTTSSSLKNDLSWRPGSDIRVATSLHGWTRSTWKNLSGKRKNTRGGSRGRGPEKYKDSAQVCRNEFTMKGRAHWNWICQNTGFLQVYQQQNHVDSVNFSKNLHVSLLKKMGNSNWDRLGSKIMCPGWCTNLGHPNELLVHERPTCTSLFLDKMLFSVVSRKMRSLVQKPHWF